MLLGRSLAKASSRLVLLLMPLLLLPFPESRSPSAPRMAVPHSSGLAPFPSLVFRWMLSGSSSTQTSLPVLYRRGLRGSGKGANLILALVVTVAVVLEVPLGSVPVVVVAC